MTVVSFIDVVPPQRFDEQPWTEYIIEESSSSLGPWLALTPVPLDPLDADPENPITRQLTTEEATLENGWYRIIFRDAQGDASVASDPILNTTDDAPSYQPSLEELGTFLKTRTRSRLGGAGIGTFDENTAVTATEALSLIQEAADEVALAIGSVMPDGPAVDPGMYRRGAKALVLLKAAMNVELALVPEQTSDPRSAYSALERRFESFLKTFIEAIGGEGDSAVDEDITPGVSELMPNFSFPTTSIGDGVMP